MRERPYQRELLRACGDAWGRSRVVMPVLPTGGGKTFVIAKAMHEEPGLSCFVAHRRELVAQAALALAREELAHRIIAPDDVIKMVVAVQQRELGRSWYSPNARAAVAGVDTLASASRAEQLKPWAAQVRLMCGDEGHHWLKKNKWGRVVQGLFAGARVMLPTATPVRADGCGLGADNDGLVDELVFGPTKRELIDEGYLCDYRAPDGSLQVYCPRSDVDLEHVPTSDATGDYVVPKLAKAVKESHIVGDSVEHYRRLIPGKRAILFAVDVEAAVGHARAFNEAGVRAEAVDCDTDPRVRAHVIEQFKRGEVKVLCNVDLFGEGFDAPGCDAVIFCRPTRSFPVYSQQWGRGDRPVYAPGWDLSTRQGRLGAIAAGPKPHMTVIDQVGNVEAHGGPPDLPRHFDLSRREKGARAVRPQDEEATRTCAQCTRHYPRFLPSCPHPAVPGAPRVCGLCQREFPRAEAACLNCDRPVPKAEEGACGWAPAPTERGRPEQVDGDLHQMDDEWLAAMAGARAQVDRGDEEVRAMMQRAGHHLGAVVGQVRQHAARRDAQGALRHSMSVWSGQQQALGRDEGERMRRFFLTFGVDVLSAQSLGRPEALALADAVNLEIGRVK